jgi:hypothetical protein
LERGEVMQSKPHLLLVVAILGMAVMACSIGNQAEAVTNDTIFQDDFSDSSSGWDRVNLPEGITDYADGVYRIYVNTENTDYWANPGLSFKDTIIEVEATKGGGPDDNDFGLICRHQNTENFYIFMISSDGFFGILRVIDGEQELLGMDEMEYSESINTGNAMNVIRADCIGSSLTLYVNSSQLISVEDSSLEAGDVGLLAGTFDILGTDIHFDNFVVRNP